MPPKFSIFTCTRCLVSFGVPESINMDNILQLPIEEFIHTEAIPLADKIEMEEEEVLFANIYLAVLSRPRIFGQKGAHKSVLFNTAPTSFILVIHLEKCSGWPLVRFPRMSHQYLKKVVIKIHFGCFNDIFSPRTCASQYLFKNEIYIFRNVSVIYRCQSLVLVLSVYVFL